MSEQVQFNDEDLKRAIIQHWGNQGITIADETASKMVEEVRSKMKSQNDLDELKLAINELKLDLSPETDATVSSGMIVESSLNLINALDKFAAFENMKVEEMKEAFRALLLAAQKAGKDIPTFRLEKQKEKDNLIKRIKRINANLEELNNYNPDEDVNKEIESLTKDEDLLNASKLEHDILTGSNVTGVNRKSDYSPITVKQDGQTTTKRITPQQLKKIDSVLGYILWEEDNDKVSKQKRVWSRKRFAFERLIGNEDTGLYKTQKERYISYVDYFVEKKILLANIVNEIEHLLTISKHKNEVINGISSNAINTSKIMDNMGGGTEKTPTQMFYKNKPHFEQEVYALQGAMKQHLQKLKEAFKEFKSSKQEADSLIQENKNKTEELLGRIEELEFTNPTIMDLDERFAFDPDFISYAMGVTGRQKTSIKGKPVETQDPRIKGKRPRQYSSPHLGSEKWSVNTENPFDSVINNMETTWKKGQIIYWAQNPPAPETQEAANAISYGDPKQTLAITQDVSISPYLTDEDREQILSRLKSYRTNAIKKETKTKWSAGTNTHWHLLFTLAKSEQPRMNLSEGARSIEKYKQLVEMNPPEVIRNVIKNTSTPSWILMFVAETDKDFSTFAINELAKRGWNRKKGKDGVQIVDSETGNWVWESKKVKAQLGFREILIAATDPQIESLKQQKEQLELQSKKITEQRRTIEIQMEQRQKALDQQKAQTTTTPNQAQDNTTAPQPSIYQSAPAVK